MTSRDRWRDDPRQGQDEQREPQEFRDAPRRGRPGYDQYQQGGSQGRNREQQFGQEGYGAGRNPQAEMPQMRQPHFAGEFLGGNPEGGRSQENARERFWDSDRERADWRSQQFDDNALGPRFGRDERYRPMRDNGFGSPRDHERGLWDRTSDEIASWFGDDEARRRREQDFRGKGPRGYKRSDDRIREDVNDRLSYDSGVDASDIEVKVANCEVTLTGNVSDRYQKRRAEDCAEAVLGVTHVQNNLRVKEPVLRDPDDTNLK